MEEPMDKDFIKITTKNSLSKENGEILNLKKES